LFFIYRNEITAACKWHCVGLSNCQPITNTKNHEFFIFSAYGNLPITASGHGSQQGHSVLPMLTRYAPTLPHMCRVRQSGCRFDDMQAVRLHPASRVLLTRTRAYAIMQASWRIVIFIKYIGRFDKAGLNKQLLAIGDQRLAKKDRRDLVSCLSVAKQTFTPCQLTTKLTPDG
jgi:hypothetical protein